MAPPPSLLATFRVWKDSESRPNLRATESTPPVMAVLNSFVATMVKNGSSPDAYSEEDWKKVLRDEGLDDPDDIGYALESIGTWTGHLGV